MKIEYKYGTWIKLVLLIEDSRLNINNEESVYGMQIRTWIVGVLRYHSCSNYRLT